MIKSADIVPWRLRRQGPPLSPLAVALALGLVIHPPISFFFSSFAPRGPSISIFRTPRHHQHTISSCRFGPILHHVSPHRASFGRSCRGKESSKKEDETLLFLRLCVFCRPTGQRNTSTAPWILYCDTVPLAPTEQTKHDSIPTVAHCTVTRYI